MIYKNIKIWLSSKLFIWGFLPLIIYLSVILWQGKNGHYLIHDNFDSVFVNLEVLANSEHLFFSYNETIPNIIGGLPRNTFGSEFNIIVILIWIFGLFNAYVINKILIHLTAYVGMYLLAKQITSNYKTSIYIPVIIAISYSLLDFWPPGGLSVAGLPLALYSFNRIKHNSENISDWIILILLPFYSNFVVCNFFFLTSLSVIWVYEFFFKHKVNKKFLSAIILQTFVFMLIEHRLILSIFNGNFTSHRIEFQKTLPVEQILPKIINFLLHGHYQATSLHLYIIFPVVILSLIILLFKKQYNNNIFKFFGCIVLIAIWYGLTFHPYWKMVYDIIPFLKTFNIGRFYFLSPLLWHVTFTFSIIEISKIIKTKYILSFFLIIILTTQIFYGFKMNEAFVSERINSPTYKNFFNKPLYSQVAQDISLPQNSYRVAGIGIHSSILIHNKFHTLDGYWVNYPLKYKKKFRKVIHRELEKSEKLRKYFDTWGNRCYLFSSEVANNFNKYYIKENVTDKVIRNLQLDITQFQKLEGKYIFSIFQIKNYKSLNLQLFKQYNSSNYPWNLFVYTLDDK